MRTPTIEPAVPGALGAKPAPPAVASATAVQSTKASDSVFVFDMSIGFGDFCRRDAIIFAGPPSQINQLAAFAAKGTVFVDGLFVTSRALHRKPAVDCTAYADSENFPIRSYSSASVISAS